MNVCCLNCGNYFGELDEDNSDFCSKECEKAFIQHLEREICEF